MARDLRKLWEERDNLRAVDRRAIALIYSGSDINAAYRAAFAQLEHGDKYGAKDKSTGSIMVASASRRVSTR